MSWLDRMHGTQGHPGGTRTHAGRGRLPPQGACTVRRLGWPVYRCSVPLQCAACSLARRTRVCSPAWCVLLEPTLRITRGLVARGAVAAVGGTRRRAVGGTRRWAVAGTCALSFFSMVLYWLTRADCDLEIFFSPSSPVSAIRFSLTALAWTGQKGRHHRPGPRAPGTTAAPHFGVHAAALASGAGEGSAGPAGGPRER